MWLACGALRAWARSPGARACGGSGGVPYTQGQSPEPRTREYFYYVDHQGQEGRGAGKACQPRTGARGRTAPRAEQMRESRQATRFTHAPPCTWCAQSDGAGSIGLPAGTHGPRPAPLSAAFPG
uniref:Uncharacterized protein n=1 Tax=Equus caballus TaxID=9796 RepID=A0A3Q2H0K1_HORSE